MYVIIFNRHIILILYCRILYVPSTGFCMLVVIGVKKITQFTGKKVKKNENIKYILHNSEF